MAFWVVRAGKHGENETYAVEQEVILLAWDEIGDLSRFKSRDDLQQHVEQTYPDELIGTQRIWTGELWAFKDRIQIDDWVAVPLKTRAALAVGRVAGAYKFVPDAPAKHQRSVKWIRTDLPRAEIDQDLLYTLGSTLTVFQARRSNAEVRLINLAQGQSSTPTKLSTTEELEGPDEGGPVDLEQFAADQIINYIGRKFRGHDLAHLVGAILTAEGYQVEVSKPGADGGVDIIAGTGPMGFASPRIAVQVKSGDTPADVSILRELQGVMPRFGAERGLVVSWSGFSRICFSRGATTIF